MKTSLIIFGVIFLVIGMMLYLIPMQRVSADTTTIGNSGVDTRTSSASVTVPVAWAFASALIGLILLILGISISGSTRRNDSRNDSKNDSYEKVVESKENVEIGDGNKHKVFKEHTETHTVRKGGHDA